MPVALATTNALPLMEGTSITNEMSENGLFNTILGLLIAKFTLAIRAGMKAKIDDLKAIVPK